MVTDSYPFCRYILVSVDKQELMNYGDNQTTLSSTEAMNSQCKLCNTTIKY